MLPPPARAFPPLTPHPQYLDNVINNSTSYANAYFELNYIRAFGVNASVVVDSSGSAVGTGGASSTATATGATASTTTSGAADPATRALWLAYAVGLVGVLSWVVL